MVIIKKHIVNRQSFLKMLNKNGIVLIFKASWCKHCINSNNHIIEILKDTTADVYNLDVDENVDIYSYMKAKKMVQGIPAILIYNCGNTAIPDDMYTGGDLNEISKFLNKQLF
jgi:thiol-disulfide isomerase/thioredoxin